LSYLDRLFQPVSRETWARSKDGDDRVPGLRSLQRLSLERGDLLPQREHFHGSAA
jgi:hypothetical protein